MLDWGRSLQRRDGQGQVTTCHIDPPTCYRARTTSGRSNLLLLSVWIGQGRTDQDTQVSLLVALSEVQMKRQVLIPLEEDAHPLLCPRRQALTVKALTVKGRLQPASKSTRCRFLGQGKLTQPRLQSSTVSWSCSGSNCQGQVQSVTTLRVRPVTTGQLEPCLRLQHFLRRPYISSVSSLRAGSCSQGQVTLSHSRAGEALPEVVALL